MEEILKELSDLYKEKSEHLGHYKKMIELMAESKSPNIFIESGDCPICERINLRIEELKKLI